MSVVGARPNFMKIAPFAAAIDAWNRADAARPIEHFLVHTGQHYDKDMSASFFQLLNIPEPNVDLGVGSGTHAEQVGRTMIALEQVMQRWRPDWLVVVGDVNATCAGAIVAKKEHVKLAHIEAGLRSFDMAMPEEINRLVTDRLSDLLLTPDAISDANLRAEGVTEARIRCVGNVMIDTLDRNRPAAAALDLDSVLTARRIADGATHPPVQLAGRDFAVLTLHRPSNVDHATILGPIVEFLIEEVCAVMPLVWSIHPRTRKQLQQFGLWTRILRTPAIVLVEPLTYHEMLKANLDARILLTDSGGLQEECCVLGTPCVTLRRNTERPVTLWEQGGLSQLVGNDVATIRQGFHAMRGVPKREHRPPLWDGHAAERIVEALVQASV